MKHSQSCLHVFENFTVDWGEAEFVMTSRPPAERVLFWLVFGINIGASRYGARRQVL